MQLAAKFGIEVNFLTGRYVATSHNDRKKAEWPPHPARLFSALVAVWAEDGSDPHDRAALEWLESQPPPAIAASDAALRVPAPHFVPVNDASIFGPSLQATRLKKIQMIQKQLSEEIAASGESDTAKIKQIRRRESEARDVKKQAETVGVTPPSAAIELFPESRGKQERFYPSVTPAVARVTYIWDRKPQDRLLDLLDHLLSRLTRLGHPSSLVSCRTTLRPPEPSHLPSTIGESIRTVKKGQLVALERQYVLHQGIRPRSLPFENVLYRAAGEDSHSEPPLRPNTAGDWILFEFAHNSRAFPSFRTAELAAAMRAAIFHYADNPIPEEISGHRSTGTPTMLPHVAFLPIPYAGFEYSDGRLLGIALSIPDSLGAMARRALFRAIGKWEEKAGRSLTLTLGSHGTVTMSRIREPSALLSLRYNIWSRQSVQWSSVTPVALPKHPGNLGKGTARARSRAWKEAESSISVACGHLGLPFPVAVEVSLEPFISGAHPISRFPEFAQNDRNGKKIKRQLIHATLTFERPVVGPLILGTGRFLGLGLMQPALTSRPTGSMGRSA